MAASKHVPQGHLFSFPDTVRAWMLEETSGHMVHVNGAKVTVYCGATRGSFSGELRKPPVQCRYCRKTIEEGTREVHRDGYVLWHRGSGPAAP